jgi:dTDP-4-amino-4,6-dideoxygalactose transaminase
MTPAPPTRVRVGDIQVDDRIREAVLRVLERGRFSEGPETRGFENEWAEYVGTGHCVAVNSGTSALIAGMLALIHSDFPTEPGKKVISTPLTYAADSNAVLLTGMEPAYVDVDPDTFGMRPDLVEKLLRDEGPEGFGLIAPVHLMGYTVDMEAICSIAERYGLPVLEDTAQAHGATVGGRAAGSWGTLSVFSFYIAHNIQAGELGAVNTGRPELARLIRQLKANGRACDCPVCMRNEGRCPRRTADDPHDTDPRFHHTRVGYNFKANDFACAIARAQLTQADAILTRRRELFAALSDRLAAHRSWLRLPPTQDGASPFAFPMVLRPDAAVTRGAVRTALDAGGIESRPLFGCLPTQQPVFAQYAERYAGRLPAAEDIGSRGFYVGCHQHVTDADVDYVGEVFDRFAKEKGLL